MEEQNKLHLQKASELNERKQQLLIFQKETQKKLADISYCLSIGDTVSATKHLKDFSIETNNKRFNSYCQDYLVDAILNSKYQKALKSNIKVEYIICLPSQYDFSSTELCSVLFNLLDNGIESCKKTNFSNAFLQLSMKIKSDFLIIRMKNSKSTQDIFCRQSSKIDHAAHGFGISIIEEIADKHDGFCKWTDLGDTFESAVMLRFRNSSSAH